MHSLIIQLDEKPVDSKNWLRESDLDDIDYIDYVDPCYGKGRIEAFEHFVKCVLPQEMFTVEQEDECFCLIYKGGVAEYSKRWLQRLRDKVNVLTPENVFRFPALDEIKRVLSRALGDTLFVMNGWTDRYPEESTEFLAYLSTLKPGTKLYVGALFDYHF